MNTTNSNITSLQTTVANNNTAQTTANNTLESNFNTKLNSTNANISSLQQTVSDNNSSTATSINNLTSSLSKQGDNLILNGDFSNGLNQWTYTPVGSSTIVYSSTSGEGNSHGLTFTRINANAYISMNNNNFSQVKPLSRFRVSVRAKGISGACQIMARFYKRTTANVESYQDVTLTFSTEIFETKTFDYNATSADQILVMLRMYTYPADAVVIVSNISLMDVTDELDNKTNSASISNLSSTVSNNASSTATSLSNLESSFNTKLNSTNSTVSNLSSTVSNNQSANATSIANLDTKFTGLNTTTNTTITNLSNAISTQNTANTTQFNLINSTLNSDITNLFYNPNALSSLSSGFSSGGATIVSSTTAHTSNVYKLIGRDNMGTKTLQVTPNDVYNLSMYCQTADTTAPNITLGMRFIDKSGATVSWAGAVSRGVNGTWAKIEGQITVPATAVTAVIWIQLNQTTTDTKYWYVTGISVSNANIYTKINAQISTLNTAMTAADTANATSISQVQTNLNNNIATVNTKIDTSINTLTNNINSTYSLTANANGVVSGIKLVANSGASTNSAIYFVADKFVVSPAASTANAKSPFTIDAGIVYLNNAMIKNASIGTALIADGSITNAKIGNAQITSAKIADAQITNAKITGDIQSDNWASGSGWRLGKSGTNAGKLELKSASTGQRIELDETGLRVYDSNNILRVSIGVI